MTIHCPKCQADISESYEPDDWSVGIVGGWYCDACDIGYGESELGEPPDDDAVIPAPRPAAELGTPISQLSGDPLEKGFDAFRRIAKSWGYAERPGISSFGWRAVSRRIRAPWRSITRSCG